MTCGKRVKGTTHKIQLAGALIQKDHVKFVKKDNEVWIIPLCKEAMPEISVNGLDISKIEGIPLRANDRIFIGPGSVFLFKWPSNENSKSRDDPIDNPITFDTALEELLAME